MLMVASGPAGPERRRVMEAGTHPSVEGIKQAVQSKGGTLSCPVCGREEFTLVEVTVLGSGMAEHVMNFDLAKLRVAGGES